MKGYKATYNMKCRGFTYEVGETYTTDSIEMCRKGFHFCEKMVDTLNYYKSGKSFILLEVEALGSIKTDGDKYVTDKIKIIRVVPREEYVDFDINEQGNLIHFKNSDGYGEWYEYRI